MDIRTRLQNAITETMKAKDKPRLEALRFIQAGVKQWEIDHREEADDTQVITLLDKMLKQRRDAAEQFTKAGRDELASKENYEIELIQEFLPKPLSESEIDNLIQTAITDTSASTMADMGKVMGKIKPQLQGRADMGKVSQKIKAQLQ